ncbi:MAG: hypothetical protein IPM04_16500 [Saprospiraceae bacterium]|nr:hypothetical protein [Candidatus Brachybacter algidus]MBK8749352.1 hypothetical protein [Candidatus Brachybacter algidus]
MMYAHGNSYSDIKRQIREIYGVDYSESSISEVTEQVGRGSELAAATIIVIILRFVFGWHVFYKPEGGKSTRKVLYSIYSIDANGEQRYTRYIYQGI